jgi:hypothetical protein
LAGWLVDWLIGWLAGRLVSQSASQAVMKYYPKIKHGDSVKPSVEIRKVYLT